MFDKKRVLVAGSTGMVGSAIVRVLEGDPGVELFLPHRHEVDLLSQKATADYFRRNSFDEVYLAAAKVGGINANSRYPADFIYENLQTQNNVIHSSFESNVERLLFLGSSCIYPKYAAQPIKENYLMTGDLEPTNAPYALAKIAGLQLCQAFNKQYKADFRALMPTNLYGPNDNFNLDNAHVVPSLLRKIHEAKVEARDSVLLWGSGMPRREFLHVDDMARACVHVMRLSKNEYFSRVLPDYQYLNVGTGEDISIKNLAETIAGIVGYSGALKFDISMPDGTPRKLLDVCRIESSGWKCQIELEDGLRRTYKWFVERIHSKDFRR